MRQFRREEQVLDERRWEVVRIVLTGRRYYKTKIEECQKLEWIEISIEDTMTDQSDQKCKKWLREAEKTTKMCKKKRRNRVI